MSEPPSPVVSRRTALRVGSGAAVALVLGLGGGWLDRRNRAEPVDRLADLLAATDATSTTSTSPTTTTEPLAIPEIGEVDAGIVALGLRAIAVHGFDDLDTLLRGFPESDDDPLAQAAALTTAEFVAGDTLVVDGWVLAASEVRAAATIALLCEGAEC